jgi:hypothetical protein
MPYTQVTRPVTVSSYSSLNEQNSGRPNACFCLQLSPTLMLSGIFQHNESGEMFVFQLYLFL